MKQMPEKMPEVITKLKQVIRSYMHRLVRNTRHGTDIAFLETHKTDCQFCVDDGLPLHSPSKRGSINTRCNAEGYKFRIRGDVCDDSLHFFCTVSFEAQSKSKQSEKACIVRKNALFTIC